MRARLSEGDATEILPAGLWNGDRQAGLRVSNDSSVIQSGWNSSDARLVRQLCDQFQHRVGRGLPPQARPGQYHGGGMPLNAYIKPVIFNVLVGPNPSRVMLQQCEPMHYFGNSDTSSVQMALPCQDPRAGCYRLPPIPPISLATCSCSASQTTRQ